MEARQPAWWVALPPGRVLRLDGRGADDLAVDLEPLPPGCPAVLRWSPAAERTTVAGHLAYVLDELERAAATLLPEWLPGAADLAGPQGAGIVAVRELARTLAAGSPHFGPFVADLAARVLSGGSDRTGRPDRFPAEVRAAGLARVLAASYRRDSAAILVDVPELPPEAERALVAAAEWLADRGGFAVWLAGAPLRAVDRVDEIRLTPPRVPVPGERVRPTVDYPAPAGRPHPASAAEHALEAALAGRSWAGGRAWNQTYRSHALAETYRLDLVWTAARCVVEVDGPDHLTPTKYAADRRRDVRLQLDGYAVLRFTNEQVLTDTGAVVSAIEQILRLRSPHRERPTDVDT